MSIKPTIAVFIFVFAIQSVAWAQEKDLDKAQEAFKAAKAAHDKGDFQKSIKKLKIAYGFYPDPMIRISIARRWLDLDEPEEALEELEQVQSKKKKVLKQLKQELEKVREVLAKLVPVVLESEPPGAFISINGGKAQKSPIKLNLKRGLLKFTATLKDYRSVDESVLVKGTRVYKKLIKMSRKMAILIVQITGADKVVEESLEVMLDGSKISHPKPIKLLPGKHVVTCGEKGDEPNTVNISVPAEKTTVVQCVLPGSQIGSGAWKSPAAWSSIAVGSAAILAGVGMFVSYAADTSAYEEPRYGISSSKPLFGGITAGLGAGLVGLGTYWLLAD